MSASMRKAVTEIIGKLKKLPDPVKKTGSFWDFMKSQLVDEGEWDQKHIKTIEKEIDAYLTKVEKKTLNEMWKATPQGEEKFDEDKSFDVKEMKVDIIDEMIGQVMDRMDDNYSSRDSYYPPMSSESYESAKKSGGGEDSSEEEAEPDDLDDDDIPLDDDDLFGGDSDDEDDDYRF